MRRHGLDPISLFFGAVFAAVGGIFLFGNIDLSRVPPAWSWPIPLMIVGALIIALAVRSDRPRHPDTDGIIPAPLAEDTPPRALDEDATMIEPEES